MSFPDILGFNTKMQSTSLETIKCSQLGWDDVWLAAGIFILITGLVANAALLGLFFKERRTLSASQVLGANLGVMNLLYLSVLPFTISDEDMAAMTTQSSSNHSVSSRGSEVKEAKNILSMFNLIGCPLLLACMCIERYLAVIRPVLYLRVRRWEYRVAVSAAVWLLTLLFCVAAGLTKDMIKMMVPVSIIISCLFLVMLTSLGGVVWSLWQQNPALTTSGNQAHCVSPLKRRAVNNVLAVVVPAVITYLPVLVMFPLVLYRFYWDNNMGPEMCIIFELSQLFPQFGLLIGPLFYLSKAKQIYPLCRKVNLNQ